MQQSEAHAALSLRSIGGSEIPAWMLMARRCGQIQWLEGSTRREATSLASWRSADLVSSFLEIQIHDQYIKETIRSVTRLLWTTGANLIRRVHSGKRLLNAASMPRTPL